MKSIFFAVFLLPFLTFAQNTDKQLTDQQFQQSILDFVNIYRKTKGLAALQMSPIIVEEAIKHSQNMATGKVGFGHTDFEKRANRVQNQIINIRGIGENVAYGMMSAKEVVNRWIQSEGHRKNIEGKFNLTGVGIFRRNDGYIFYTQIFASQ